jgi:hypothetical protein
MASILNGIVLQLWGRERHKHILIIKNWNGAKCYPVSDTDIYKLNGMQHLLVYDT